MSCGNCPSRSDLDQKVAHEKLQATKEYWKVEVLCRPFGKSQARANCLDSYFGAEIPEMDISYTEYS